MDEDEDQEPRSLGAERLDWLDAPLLVLGLVTDILDAFSQATVNARVVLAMHANWQLERRHFRAGAKRDIDALTGGAE